MMSSHVPAPSAPPKPNEKRPRSFLVVTALVVAALALVVGVASLAVSALALGRSDQARDMSTRANTRPAPVPAAEPTAAQATPDATAETATDATTQGPADAAPTPTEISPTAAFTVAYEGQRLRVRSQGCDNSDNTEVDLDEPRVVGDQIYVREFGYQGCNPGQLVSELPMAQVANPAATPKDCLEKIRTDPGRSPIAPTQGMTLCFLTDQNEAAAEGSTQKLVFATVDSIKVDNEFGVLNVTVKAWAVPR